MFRHLQWLLAAGMFMPLLSNAQPIKIDTPKAIPPSPLFKSSAAQPVSSVKPLWSELTPLQQQALQPLAGTWGTISEAQKRKWLAVSKNYASLQKDGQVTMHGRMNEWVSLTPLQRAQARLNFATTKELSRQLTPEEKLAKWQTYQSLSADEKKRLVEKALPKPTGAALAIKPVAPQKLAPVQPRQSVTTTEPPRDSPSQAPIAAVVAPALAASAP